MSQTLTEPILGLGREFPESLIVLHHPATGTYGCYGFNGVHGLACFTSEQSAIRFGSQIDLPGMITLRTTFDEAREIAKSRPAQIVALILLDPPAEPLVHYIR